MPYEAHNRRHATIRAKGDETTKHWYVNGQDGGPAFKTVMDFTIVQRDILLVRQGRPPWLDHPDAPWLEGLGWRHPSTQPQTITSYTESHGEAETSENEDYRGSKNVTVEEVNGVDIMASQGWRTSSLHTASRSQHPPAPSQYSPAPSYLSSAPSELRNLISTSTTLKTTRPVHNIRNPSPSPSPLPKARTTSAIYKPQTITSRTRREEKVENYQGQHGSGSDTEGAAPTLATETLSPSPKSRTTTTATTQKPQTITLHTSKEEEEEVETLKKEKGSDTEATSSRLLPQTITSHTSHEEDVEACESQHDSDTEKTSRSPELQTISTHTNRGKEVESMENQNNSDTKVTSSSPKPQTISTHANRGKVVETISPCHARRTFTYALLALFLFWYLAETILHSYIGKPTSASPFDTYNPTGPIWGESIPHLLFGKHFRSSAGFTRRPRQALESLYEWAIRVSFTETERKAMRLGVPLAAVYDSGHTTETEVVIARYEYIY